MKSKLNYILIGILVSFSFMNNVFAEDALEFEVYVDHNNIEVVSGTDATVLVGVKSDSYIHACTFQIVKDSGIETLEPKGVNGFNVSPGDEKINVMDSGTSGDAPTDGLNILQLNYKINSSGKIVIKTIECASFDDEKTGTYSDVEVNFVAKELSEDNTLKSVKINDEMVPNFSPDGNNYAVELDKSSFSLSFETTNPDYQDDVVVKFNGNVISSFDNIVWSDSSYQNIGSLELIVNNKKSYLIGIQYIAKDLDNTLKSLKINGNEVDLQSGNIKYSIKVGKDVTNLVIEAELNDSEHFKLVEPFVNGRMENGCPGNTCSFTVDIEPVDDKIGGSSLSYIIEVVKEGGTTVDKPIEKPISSSKPVNNDVGENPQTGDISMFLMALILISSLVGSVLLYQKNMEGYK